MKLKLLLVLLLLIPGVIAHSHYSYELAESLKPLIEWRDYSPGAFDEAVAENKPIFLLLTAPSWCYWCQVYESEEYLFNSRIVEMINSNFIPIYVDADQRQDLTRQYLEGGWPSTTIMAPNRERIYGFSGPRPVENMLTNMRNAVNYVSTNGFSSSVNYDYEKREERIPTLGELNNVISGYAYTILQSHDSQYGGFGNGQKFPQGRSLDYALEIYERSGSEEYLRLVEKTLGGQYTDINKLESDYNLFDPVEGGFHRYGTKRDYTPPHYEKMLYDNARLLKAYYHLLQIEEGMVVREVVEKTDDYVQTMWFDSEDGGFYGNTDVHGEDHYYGKNPRPGESPRVEETKYTDWNSEAILTYLYLWEESGDERYKNIAVRSLDFYLDEMISDEGAYHFITPEGEKGVRGGLLDNSNLMLAFVEGYEVLGDEKYLGAAEGLADYSLREIYDWNSGGFFERNSPDMDDYARGDNINLGKPGEENGIISYALLKLYVIDGDVRYLNAGLKSYGAMFERTGGLDDTYYYAKGAEFILENGLIGEYEGLEREIQNVEREGKGEFWLDDLLSGKYNSITGFVVSDEGLDQLRGPLVILIFVAFIAGLVSFASPCTLPILPAYVAFSLKTEKHNIKAMTFMFFIGMAIVFSALGMSASIIGGFLKDNLESFSKIAGVGIILFGLVMISGKGVKGLKIKHKKPAGYFGSLLFGGVIGLSWTPCVGPILIAILLLASTIGSFLSGGLMLFSYAVGLALPLILFSNYVGRVDRNGKFWRFVKGKEIRVRIDEKVYSWHTTSILSGVLFIILGYLIFSGTLASFNQYVIGTGFQKWIFGVEDKILSWVR